MAPVGSGRERSVQGQCLSGRMLTADFLPPLPLMPPSFYSQLPHCHTAACRKEFIDEMAGKRDGRTHFFKYHFFEASSERACSIRAKEAVVPTSKV